MRLRRRNAWDDAAEAVVANASVADGDDATNGFSSLDRAAAPATEDVPLSVRPGSSLRVAELARRDRPVYVDTGEDPVREVKKPHDRLPEQHGEVNIVDGVPFVRPGETMGLWGVRLR